MQGHDERDRLQREGRDERDRVRRQAEEALLEPPFPHSAAPPPRRLLANRPFAWLVASYGISQLGFWAFFLAIRLILRPASAWLSVWIRLLIWGILRFSRPIVTPQRSAALRQAPRLSITQGKASSSV